MCVCVCLCVYTYMYVEYIGYMWKFFRILESYGLLNIPKKIL